MIRLLPVLMLPLLAACEPAPSQAPQATGPRPIDEVPQQSTLANGDRQYGFASGCVIAVESRQAVVKSETGACELHHRDIALLYAAGD